ncbi:ATP-dependent helicase [Sphingomonas sp. M1A8_2b]
MSAVQQALDELTDAQAAAVSWDAGSLFVLAGPGSGKTRVLTTRVARILNETPDRSFRILALTFTNKAADEMSARVAALVPDQQQRAAIGTFHSFCMQMLQQHGAHVGIKPDFAIYSLEADRMDLLKDAIREASLDPDSERYLPVIDKLKAQLIGPEGSALRFRDTATGLKVEATYKAYDEALQRSNALDFGSLIINAYLLVSKFPGVSMHYRRSYAYWMFDEFQDTTDGQYRLIRALAGDEFKNVFAVADDDQIIYQWNGASYQQIQRFRADYKPAEIQLPTNYRCPPSIVAAANKLVIHNTQRTSTKQPLLAGKTKLLYPDQQHIRVARYSSEDAEVSGIAEGISQVPPARRSEVVVLARTRALLDKMHAALAALSVPANLAVRRDDFRSAQFLWLAATLRLASRPMDRRAFEALIGAFNRWFDSDLRSDELVLAANLSARSFLAEWIQAVSVNSDSRVQSMAEMTELIAEQPSRFRDFISQFLELLPSEENEIADDVGEDKSAWMSLSRSIGQSIGRDAPLEMFLQELALRSKEPPLPADSVSLMTIHGAKGKEFDHVYVIGLAEDVLPSFQSLKAGEDSAEMEEERRNCFVAITRAREWLCLSYADRYRGWAKQPSRFLTEMEIALPPVPIA